MCQRPDVGTNGVVHARDLSLEQCASDKLKNATELCATVLFGHIIYGTYIPLWNWTNYFGSTTLHWHRKTYIQPHCHFRWQS